VKIGEVTPNKEAVVGLTVLGPDGPRHNVSAVLDN
jgi:hypothetical protein